MAEHCDCGRPASPPAGPHWWPCRDPEPGPEVTVVVRHGDHPDTLRFLRMGAGWYPSSGTAAPYSPLTEPAPWATIGWCEAGHQHPVVDVTAWPDDADLAKLDTEGGLQAILGSGRGGQPRPTPDTEEEEQAATPAAGTPDRNAQVDLLAAAMCDAAFYPGAWDVAGPIHRAAYRRDADELVDHLDQCAAVRAARATVSKVVARAEANATRDQIAPDRCRCTPQQRATGRHRYHCPAGPPCPLCPHPAPPGPAGPGGP